MVVDRMTYRAPLIGEDRERGVRGDNWETNKEEASRFCAQYGLQAPPDDGVEFAFTFHPKAEIKVGEPYNDAYFNVASNADRQWQHWDTGEDGIRYSLVVRVSDQGEI